MATRGARNSGYARVAYAAAAICFTFAALAGAVAAAAATTNTGVTSVSVRDFAFVPDSLTVVKGTQVRFTNTGQALHRVVSDDGSFDSHPLQPGHNATFTFTTIGVFHLHCEIHPSMTMTVDVVAATPNGAPIPADSGSGSGTSKTATEPLPTTLPHTGMGTGSIVLSVLGLGLILLGLLFLAVGHSGLSTIPSVAAIPSGPASTIARVMGWENRFDDLLPGRRPRPGQTRR